jgi:hypothetical protein
MTQVSDVAPGPLVFTCNAITFYKIIDIHIIIRVVVNNVQRSLSVVLMQL